MRTALLILAAALAQAQVTIQLTPEPMEVSKSINLKNIGLWDVLMCNASAGRPVELAPERIRMAFPGVRIIAMDRARLVVNEGNRWTWRSIALTGGEFIGMGLMTYFGFGDSETAVKVSKETLTWIAGGTMIAHRIMDRIKGEQPDLSLFTGTMLDAPVKLGPGECTSKTVFAGKMKNPQAIQAVIGGPSPVTGTQGTGGTLDAANRTQLADIVPLLALAVMR